jgi:hypothetical protein
MPTRQVERDKKAHRVFSFSVTSHHNTTHITFPIIRFGRQTISSESDHHTAPTMMLMLMTCQAPTLIVFLLTSIGLSLAQNNPYCNPCGRGMAVGAGSNEISIPTKGTFTCELLEQRAREGFVPRDNCRTLQIFTSGENCGCVPKTPRPTPVPTTAPSESPSLSIAPSEMPSQYPSSDPSAMPSSAPTNRPSEWPTMSPQPSSAPTKKMTSFPTFSPSQTPSIETASPSDSPTASPIRSNGPPIRTRSPAAGGTPGLIPVRGYFRGTGTP